MNEFALLESGLSNEFLRYGVGETRRKCIHNGLLRLNILKQGEKLINLTDCNPWHQGGGETFVADSIIKVDSNQKIIRHVIAKALFSFGSPPDIQLQCWLKRRTILEKLGVRVPHMYIALDGTIYEEFIESEVDASCFSMQDILKELAHIASILDSAGFSPLSFLHDLRRRNNKLYYVDFGFDLGGSSTSTQRSARLSLEKKIPEPYRTRCLEYYEKRSCHILNNGK